MNDCETTATKRAAALRYLLLRHLWRAGDCLPRDAAREMVRTLHVQETPDGYAVAWEAAGEPKRHVLARDAFRFFSHPAAGSAAHSQPPGGSANDRAATAFLARALNLSAWPAMDATAPFRPRWRSLAASLGLLGLAAGLAAGEPWLGLLLGAALAAETPGPGRGILASAATAAMALVGHPLAAGLTLCFQALCHAAAVMEPRPGLAAAGCAVLGLPLVLLGGPLHLSWWTPLAAALAGALFLARWLRGAHYRIMPLCLPVLAVGLALEGANLAAGCVLALGAAELWAGKRWTWS